MTDLSRRDVTAAMLGGAALIGAGAARAAWGSADPFTLGVASGEPRPDGVVLWTRLAPVPLAGDGGMPASNVPVRWEIAETESFANARHGTALAEPGWGHSVHVEVAGLRPDRHYFYRFIAGGVASPVGRTRTAPAPGAMTDRLRFAFASCQNYEAGYFSGYRHMVADDPDLIVFLGDYIYEAAPGTAGVRKHLNPEPTDIGGYRARYANYKGDPLLQAAHCAAPWITTWDDHEVQDNYAGDLDKHNGDPAAFRRLRAAAYQAYYEHMPLRRTARPNGPAMRLYRTIDWGGLAQFQVIDDRQYRDPPPCQLPDAVAKHLETIWLRPDCDERHGPRRTILGAAQERWLGDRLKATRAQWNLLTQQTLMMPYTRIPPDAPGTPPSVHNTDSWDGYPAARDRVVRQWRDARTPNPVILSGDIHAFVAGDHSDPDDPKRIVASEFVGGSLTSNNHDATLKEATAQQSGFRFAENAVRGYGRVDLTPKTCEIAFRGLANVRDPNSGVRDLARFAVENGRAGIQRG